jgi:hypothetical protein
MAGKSTVNDRIFRVAVFDYQRAIPKDMFKVTKGESHQKFLSVTLGHFGYGSNLGTARSGFAAGPR